MKTRLYVPRDTASLAVGADAVARALEAEARKIGREVEIIRNGSRGAFFLETLVEVEAAGTRIGYGPVETRDVAGLVADGLLDGQASRLRLGPVEDIPFLKRQTRLTFSRAGVTDP